MKNIIYILSDESSLEEKYKVGSHSGSLSKLKSRYITPIPKLKIHYFIKHNNARSVETIFKQLYINQRVINSNGKVSEWVQAPLEEIFNTIIILIYRSENNFINDNGTIIVDKNQINEKVSNIPIIQNIELNISESVKISPPQDTIAVFFQEDIIKEGDEGYKDTWVSGSQCYSRYTSRCKANNVQPMSQKDFGIKMKLKVGGELSKGKNWKISNGVKYRLCLNSDDPRTPQNISTLVF
jgi:hypothetical protein